MHSQSLLTAMQHINWLGLIKNHHTRHYMWEVSKVLVPAFLTGLITFVAMKITDSRNKKRWLHDGHIKRKTDIEIEIRKILLGVKANTSSDYESLADWSEKAYEENIDKRLVIDFYKNFEALCNYLKNTEGEDDSNTYQYKKIFALIDEYECYIPKMNKLFSDFKQLYDKIFELKELSNFGGNVVEEAQKSPEHFDSMVNAYLCFQLVIDNILKKITVKKLK